MLQLVEVKHRRDERFGPRCDDEIVVGDCYRLAVSVCNRDSVCVRVDPGRRDARADIEIEGGTQLLDPHHSEVLLGDGVAQVIRQPTARIRDVLALFEDGYLGGFIESS